MKFENLKNSHRLVFLACIISGCSVPPGVGPQDTNVGAVISRQDKTTPLTNAEVTYQQEEIAKIQKRESEREQRELDDLKRQEYHNSRLREYENNH